jgi:hypothetical protein
MNILNNVYTCDTLDNKLAWAGPTAKETPLFWMEVGLEPSSMAARFLPRAAVLRRTPWRLSGNVCFDYPESQVRHVEQCSAHSLLAQ